MPSYISESLDQGLLWTLIVPLLEWELVTPHLSHHRMFGVCEAHNWSYQYTGLWSLSQDVTDTVGPGVDDGILRFKPNSD